VKKAVDGAMTETGIEIEERRIDDWKERC